MKRQISRLSLASVSPICVFFFRFVRTILLSHYLSPDHLGAAVALVSILAGCETITDIGLDRFVIVTDGGNKAQAVAAALQIAVGRAIILASAIALFSNQLAGLFGASEHLRGVAWLSLLPLIASFRNWRIVQIQQDYQFGPEALTYVCGQLAAISVVIPACMWFGDERALLVSLFSEVLVSVILSHVLVPRVRVKRVDPAVRKAAIMFGLPLMVNGVGLMLLRQFDQVIVANLFGLQMLAVYAISLNLAITPTSPLQTIAQKIGLPFLGRSRDDPQVATRASLLVLLGLAGVAAAYSLAIGLSLDWLVPLLYGHQYQITETFCALAMFDAFLRFCRGGPNMLLLHHGLTRRLTVGNLIVGVGLVIGLLLARATGRLEGVLAGLVVGDIVSLLLLFALLRQHLKMTTAMIHFGIMMAVVGTAALVLGMGGVPTIRERAFLLLAGGLVIGADGLYLYQRFARVFLAGVRQGGRPPLHMVPASGTVAVQHKSPPLS
jgi:O-antigen/teichoic acid export membrane protein